MLVENNNPSGYPHTRVARLMKKIPGVQKISKEAVHAVSKASEMFTKALALQAAKVCLEKKKISANDSHSLGFVTIKDVVHTIQQESLFSFLQEDACLQFLCSEKPLRTLNDSIAFEDTNQSFSEQPSTHSQPLKSVVRDYLKRRHALPTTSKKKQYTTTLDQFFF